MPSDTVLLGIVAIVPAVIGSIAGVLVSLIGTRRVVRTEVAKVATVEQVAEVHSIVNHSSEARAAENKALQREINRLNAGGIFTPHHNVDRREARAEVTLEDHIPTVHERRQPDEPPAAP